MSLPQTEVVRSFVKPWLIRRPIVYRYLEKQFVDLFFNEGKLRLSSFSKFKEHKDEHRKDELEGRGALHHQNLDKKTSQLAWLGPPENAYVLCGSTVYDLELADKFCTNSGFRINDTTMFAQYISNSMVNFIDGMEGTCSYLQTTYLQRSATNFDLNSFKSDQQGNSIDGPKMMDFFVQISRADLLFSKQYQYRYQSEYRMIWFIDGMANETIDIICPGAVQYCTRFEDHELQNQFIHHNDMKSI